MGWRLTLEISLVDDLLWFDPATRNELKLISSWQGWITGLGHDSSDTEPSIFGRALVFPRLSMED
jgi:hypothetical protein